MNILRNYTLVLFALLTACNSSPEPENPLLGTLATSTTLRIPVVSAADDAEEIGARSVQISGGLLDLGAKDGVKQTVGVRFQKVAIPRGAKITGARLEVAGGANDSDAVRLQVSGEATANAAIFTTASYNLSSRKKTAATFVWRPNAWAQGQPYKTGDLSAIVQEVVSRTDWRSGNALALFIAGIDGTGERSVIAYGGEAKYRPMLVVTFETGETAPTPEPTPTPEPELTPSDPGGVSSSQREWHQRLLATIENPRYTSSSLDPKKLAASGDLYRLGREFNHVVTNMSMAYRETGDRDIARYLDGLMKIVKSELRDTNGDGYRNFRWLLRSGPNYGKDTHEMDEILAHSTLAAAAHTLKRAGYSSSARFWTDYLENDFEAKWRERKGKPSGFPFLGKDLMHPYANFVRYHFYMYKLTGDSAYYSEAKRMVGVVKRNMRSSGSASVWDHRVKLSGSASRGCQPMVYVRLSTQAFADLGSQGVFDSSFMRGVAKTMAYKAVRSSSLAGDICGSGSYGSLYTINTHPYTALAAWDSSGKLKAAAERAYAAGERRNLSSPASANTPAIMVFTLGR